MARRPRLQKLTVSLAKEDVGREGVLRDPGRLSSFVVRSLDRDLPSLFIASSPPHEPRWASYLNEHVVGEPPQVYAASSSAVLLVGASDRLFAVTFGQGRHLLDPDAFEQDFGLKVVLNTVAPDRLKSVDAKTIEETTLHTRRDVSRDSSFSAFGLDVSRDLLRAVTGTPQDEALGPRLAGADALGLHTRAQVPELPALAARLLEAYGATEYRVNFDFIDYLRPEKSPGRLQVLDDLLVDALRRRSIDNLHLAAPETLDWLDIAGFRFSGQPEDGELESDPRISTYLAGREDADLTLDKLKRDKLMAIRASSGEPQASWSVRRCIVYETALDDDLYVLSGGEWFRVNLDFKERAYADVEGLRRLPGLPDADRGTNEDAYNVKAARAIDALCLDKKFVFEGPDKMEICDVLTRAGGLIHVKHRGSSSTLSHLFAQGLNSAQRLLQDQDFRAMARDVVAAEDATFIDALPADRPDAAAHEVSFVVITRSDRDSPLTLPFFSVVSLRTAAQRLMGFGFQVSVAAVRER
jgi:uncharacterized protein (TIGR04141 family)